MDILEQNIVNKLKQNDEEGLRLLFERYYIPLCVFVLKYIDSYSDAEDIVQNVFVKFWEEKKVDSLTTSLKSYMFTAVKNNTFNFIRINKRFQMVELNNNCYLEDEVLDVEELEQKRRSLYAEIDKLSPRQKKIFNAIIFENKKYKEIANELNISVNTVKTHFSRALKQLRASINLIVSIVLV